MQRPRGKVVQQADGLFLPTLVWQHRRVPLGSHATEAVAQATYDIAKLLLVRKLGGEHEPLEGLKLHRPAAVYTSHPLWEQLSGEHCSFEEACSLLASGAAEDLLASGRELRLKRPAAGAAAQQRSKRAWEEPLCCARCGSGGLSSTLQPGGQQRLCSACSGTLQGQPPAAAAAAAAQPSTDGSGRAAAHAGQRAPVQTAGQKARQTSWSGLEPTDRGVYCLKLSRSVAEGKGGIATVPARYARAAFGGATDEVPTSVTLTMAGTDRQFTCGLSYNQRSYGYVLSTLRQLRRALNAETGDLLCFEPTGHGTATISLRKAATEAAAEAEAGAGGSSAAEVAAAGAGGSGAAEAAAAAASAEGSKGEAAGLPPTENAGRQRALQELFDDSD